MEGPADVPGGNARSLDNGVGGNLRIALREAAGGVDIKAKCGVKLAPLHSGKAQDYTLMKRRQLFTPHSTECVDEKRGAS